MDAPTITMPKKEAEEKLLAYRESTRRRGTDEEHAQLADAYEALAKGTPLISLQDSVRFAGLDDGMRPNVAIARADRTQVRFEWRYRQMRAVFDTHSPRARRRFDALAVRVDMGQRNERRHERGWGMDIGGYALVPMIPADVRNRMTGQPRDHFILWEVEEWSDSPIGVQPDIDPLLLKHIGGDLYAVLDSWDLTEIERLIMRGRAER
jgi:hypothetical protein